MRILLISYLLTFFSCVNKLEDINFNYSDDTLGDFAENIELSYYLKENLEFKLIAPEMNQLTEINTFPNGIDVYVYNQNFDTIATISADYAIQNKITHIVEVSRNVILINSDMEQLNTEQLFFF